MGKAEDILRYAVDQFGDRLIQAISFQKEASVILDMLMKINPDARFFTIDNGNLFPETLEVWQQIEQRYDTKIEVFHSLEFAPQHRSASRPRPRTPGPARPTTAAVPTRSPRCSPRCWASTPGSPACAASRAHTRGETRKVQWDAKNDLWKVCPLADWTERDVWNYIFENDVPYNKLHDQGYSSIGCTNCTHPGEGREGRWAGSDKTECGLHG